MGRYTKNKSLYLLTLQDETAYKNANALKWN